MEAFRLENYLNEPVAEPQTQARSNSANKRSVYSTTLILFVLSLLVYSLPLGARPVFSRGEAREATVTQAMFQQGDFILPLRNNIEVPSKPPMLHWLSAISSSFVGSVGPFSIRFPSALLSAVALAYFFFFLVNRYDRPLAFLGATILATSIEWIRNSSHSRVDMCFSAGILIALLALFQSFDTGEKSSSARTSRFLFIAAVATSFSILSKGPAAVLFITLIGGLFLFTFLDKPLGISAFKFKWKPYFLAALASVVLAAFWYIAAYLHRGEDFLAVQLFRENFARIVPVEGQVVGHEKPFYCSVIYLFLGFLPWSLLLPYTCYYLVKRRKEAFAGQDEFPLFAAIWVIVFLTVASISVSKRPVYLLPAFPPLAFLTALTLRGFSKNHLLSMRFVRCSDFLLGAVAVASLLLATGVLLSLQTEWLQPVLVHFFHEPDISRTLMVISNPFTLPGLISIAVVSGSVFLYKPSSRNINVFTSKILATVGAIYLIASFLVLPQVASSYDQSDFFTHFRTMVPPGTKLESFKEPTHLTIYYANHPIEIIDTHIDRSVPHYVIIQKRHVGEFKEAYPSAKIFAEETVASLPSKQAPVLAYIPVS